MGKFSHVVACRSSLKNAKKMNLQLIWNKNSPWAHIELEIDVLGVAEKLIKYVIHWSQKNLKNIYLSSFKVPK
jgi:hypothetical protein